MWPFSIWEPYCVVGAAVAAWCVPWLRLHRHTLSSGCVCSREGLGVSLCTAQVRCRCVRDVQRERSTTATGGATTSIDGQVMAFILFLCLAVFRLNNFALIPSQFYYFSILSFPLHLLPLFSFPFLSFPPHLLPTFSSLFPFFALSALLHPLPLSLSLNSSLSTSFPFPHHILSFLHSLPPSPTPSLLPPLPSSFHHSLPPFTTPSLSLAFPHYAGHHDPLELLLKLYNVYEDARLQPNLTDKDGNTIFHLAAHARCSPDSIKVIKLLCENNYNPNL